MKATMKILVVVVMAVMMVTSVFAKENKSDRIDLAEQGYADALKSDVTGLRNNALLQIVKMQSDYQDVEFSKLKKIVKQMSKDDPFLVLRTNAHMTMIIMENPLLANLVDAYDYEDANQYFDTFYLKLAENQVAMK
jgi:hypothetical protein